VVFHTWEVVGRVDGRCCQAHSVGEGERGEGEFMSYFEIFVHSLVSVDIPEDKNLPSPSHSVIFYKRKLS